MCQSETEENGDRGQRRKAINGMTKRSFLSSQTATAFDRLGVSNNKYKFFPLKWKNIWHKISHRPSKKSGKSIQFFFAVTLSPNAFVSATKIIHTGACN